VAVEADSGQPEITIEHQSGTIGTNADPADVSDRARTCAIVRGVVTESSEACELSNVVETALVKALVLAAEAKRWASWCRLRASSQGAELETAAVARMGESRRAGTSNSAPQPRNRDEALHAALRGARQTRRTPPPHD